jgi:hypothetical protein
MSKSRRNLDEDKKIKRVGKTVKQKLDKYPALIYNMYSSDNTDEIQGVMDELYNEERNNKYITQYNAYK